MDDIIIIFLATTECSLVILSLQGDLLRFKTKTVIEQNNPLKFDFETCTRCRQRVVETGHIGSNTGVSIAAHRESIPVFDCSGQN